ncbi:MAG TPA: hypothetical protein VH186_33890 [Chloroflexia bacterium]|nr:hypothetical protein [Chloroflexia bacterium]
MLKNFFKLLVGVFGSVLAVLLSLQIAPGTMNTVVIVGLAGFFVILIVIVMAFTLVVVSRTQAQALVRVSERAMESQVRIAMVSRANREALDQFLEAGGLVLEKEGNYYLTAPGYQKPVPVEETGLNEDEVDYLIQNQEA